MQTTIILIYTHFFKCIYTSYSYETVILFKTFKSHCTKTKFHDPTYSISSKDLFKKWRLRCSFVCCFLSSFIQHVERTAAQRAAVIQEQCCTRKKRCIKTDHYNYHRCLHPEAHWYIPGNVCMNIHFFPLVVTSSDCG